MSDTSINLIPLPEIAVTFHSLIIERHPLRRPWPRSRPLGRLSVLDAPGTRRETTPGLRATRPTTRSSLASSIVETSLRCWSN